MILIGELALAGSPITIYGENMNKDEGKQVFVKNIDTGVVYEIEEAWALRNKKQFTIVPKPTEIETEKKAVSKPRTIKAKKAIIKKKVLKNKKSKE